MMDYQSDVEDSGDLQANPFATMKTTTMIVPTPSKIEINGKRGFLEAMEVEQENSEASKRKPIESEKKMVEFGSKKMKQKLQGPYFEVQEQIFSETQEGVSSDKFKSRNYLYDRYRQENKVSSK